MLSLRRNRARTQVRFLLNNCAGEMVVFGRVGKMTTDSLAIAIEALSWMAYEGIGERTALFRAADQLGIREPSELRQAHRLIMETTRFRNRLDSVVTRAVGEDEIKRAPHGIASFLRILSYLEYVEGSPRRELLRVVKSARQILGWKELHPFEKAIGLVASGSLRALRGELTESEKVALETCHPVWYVEKTIRVFGRDFALKMLRRNLSRLPSYVRLNTLAIPSPDSATRIIGQMQGSKIPELDGVWKIEKASDILTGTNLIQSGSLVMQDLTSIVAGLVTTVKQNQSVLDLCAAPGNKTTHLAALMKDRGEICSIDISDRRLSHWKREMKRTRVSIAHAIRADAANPPIQRKMDVVLVDPPCSNTGVFAKNPSIKWRITPPRVNEYATKQYSILKAAADQVDSGGTLVYCTCSILPDENEFVIENFLRRNQEFKVVPQTPFLGSPGLRGLEQCQRFYPHLQDCNGYFIAKLRRID